jgi:glycosyltransferase involved in cell wall biosynthesis
MTDPGIDLPVLHLSHSRTSSDGGIATALETLQTAQRSAGIPVIWRTADALPPWQRDRQLLRQIRGEVVSMLHLHGLWRSPTRIARSLQAGGLPLVIAPHGMLDPWAMRQSRWRKSLVWRLWEAGALHRANCLHALCRSEAEAMRDLGLTGPLAVIPNGVRLPDLREGMNVPPPWSGSVPSGERVLLFLGRFHAKKGLIPLLEGWRRVSHLAVSHGWWLVFVGYGDGGVLAAQVRDGGYQRVLVLGPSFGEERQACLANATSFILPSHSEGLPMAALEAMSWRLPCVLSPACNLPEAIAARAALPVTPTAAGVSTALHQLLELPADSLASMGWNGRNMVRGMFSLDQVGQLSAELYLWLLDKGPPPSCLF